MIATTAPRLSASSNSAQLSMAKATIGLGASRLAGTGLYASDGSPNPNGFGPGG